MELTSILELPEGPARTAALVAWLQALFPGGAEPVLVGGAAVELYTGGAYVTGDLDLVGFVPREVAAVLRDSGFTRKGRHWLHEKVLWRAQEPAVERVRLVERASALNAGDALRALLAFARRVGRRQPTPEEIEQWAQRGP